MGWVLVRHTGLLGATQLAWSAVAAACGFLFHGYHSLTVPVATCQLLAVVFSKGHVCLPCPNMSGAGK